MGLEILLGVGVKGAEKEGMRFKPWVQALHTLICHSEPGLFSRLCWPELPGWGRKEFWSTGPFLFTATSKPVLWVMNGHLDCEAVNDPGPQEVS